MAKLRQQSEKIRNNVTEFVSLIKKNPGEYKEIVTELRDFINKQLSPEATMACYHFNMSVISRGKRNSVVAACVYQRREIA